MKNYQGPKNQRELAESKFNTARANLLLVIALTALNIIMFIAGSETMFLFSATVPYFIAAIGAMSEFAVLAVICFVIAFAIILIYILCWYFSKKHYGFMIAALVLFVIDSMAMVGIYAGSQDFASGIIDIIIHIWVLYYLIMGVKYGKKLKELPEEIILPIENIEQGEESVELIDTPVLRYAATDVKFKVLLEADHGGYHISYRRVKHVNELVINGKVYAEMEMVIEPAHSMSATVDGHTFVVGFDGLRSFINVDGQELAKKVRLI